MVKKGFTGMGWVLVRWPDVGQGHLCPFSSQLNLSAHTTYRVVDLVVMLLVTLVGRLVAVMDPASSFFLDPWSWSCGSLGDESGASGGVRVGIGQTCVQGHIASSPS